MVSRIGYSLFLVLVIENSPPQSRPTSLAFF